MIEPHPYKVQEVKPAMVHYAPEVAGYTTEGRGCRMKTIAIVASEEEIPYIQDILAALYDGIEMAKKKAMLSLSSGQPKARKRVRS